MISQWFLEYWEQDRGFQIRLLDFFILVQWWVLAFLFEQHQKLAEIWSENLDLAQEWKNPTIWSENLDLASNTLEITAKASGTIASIDMKYLNSIARTLGAPWDLSAGIYLHKKLHASVKKWDVLYTLYAQSANKLALAQELLTQKDFITIE